MSLHEPLTADLEAQAQNLAARIRARADADILALARLLVSKGDAEVFGDTEFEARNLVHHVGAVALEERLKKSLATKARASTAPAVNSPRSSRGTARKRR
jgi:predicted lipid carrier protein YhbT